MNLLAPNTMEIPFVFNHIEDCQSMTGPISRSMKELEIQVSTAWTSLARNGDPNHKGLPNWPAYSAEQKVVMVFNTPNKVEFDPGAELRKQLIEHTLPQSTSAPPKAP
jgi:para-nitrobenzyl esterase